MKRNLPTLPLGESSFTNLRHDKSLYVDKTEQLMQLIVQGRYYFLSRPRRFGKSLMVSTLKAMFSGKYEYFHGLAAENWVIEQNRHPAPVLHLDMSAFGEIDEIEKWERGIGYSLQNFASLYQLPMPQEDNIDLLLPQLLRSAQQKLAQTVILIDEYDYPLLSALDDPKRLEAIRKRLRSFYIVIKSCAEHLRFLFITGISKFTKTGIFSALNNLVDISMERYYGTIAGYTQSELENNFSVFIDDAFKQKLASSRQELLDKIKDYYNGFSFDGHTKVYNPFYILNFFRNYKFSNYWYESGSVTFIENYFKSHNIESPDKYHLIKVQKTKMAAREIEKASPESVLYQAGYLTIVQETEEALILDYPNLEVLHSLSEMYLSAFYQIPNYNDIGKRLWMAVRREDLTALAKEYNAALAALPYQDFADHSKACKQYDESFYRSLLLMLLRGCGLQAQGEVPSCRGRSDVLIKCQTGVLIIEFTLAKTAKEHAAKRREGEKQIIASGYLEPYATGKIAVKSAVFVVDTQKRQVVF
ncbi:MAG: AAA family ATPase [Desulfovibrio sp.]|nr:AAA family ATPase [Desulfovibrio sp.]